MDASPCLPIDAADTPIGLLRHVGDKPLPSGHDSGSRSAPLPANYHEGYLR